MAGLAGLTGYGVLLLYGRPGRPYGLGGITALWPAWPALRA